MKSKGEAGGGGVKSVWSFTLAQAVFSLGGVACVSTNATVDQVRAPRSSSGCPRLRGERSGEGVQEAMAPLAGCAQYLMVEEALKYDRNLKQRLTTKYQMFLAIWDRAMKTRQMTTARTALKE